MNKLILLIIIANVIASYKGFQDSYFFEKYKFQIAKINTGEKLRMLTSGFLHADWMHLGFNMYALWIFGKIVVNNFSNLNFIIIYFVSLITGSLYTLFFHQKEPYYSAVGASGAVSGIIFSSIVIYPKMELIMFPIPLPLPGYIFAIGYLLYSIYGMKQKLGNIGHSAHLGGAIGGFVTTLILKPYLFSNNPTMMMIIGAIIIGLLVFGKKLKTQ